MVLSQGYSQARSTGKYRYTEELLDLTPERQATSSINYWVMFTNNIIAMN